MIELWRNSEPNNLSGKIMQLEETEKKLRDSESKLARLRSRNNAMASKGHPDKETRSVKAERRSTSPINRIQGSSSEQRISKPKLLVPAVTPKVSQPFISGGSSGKALATSDHTNSSVKGKKDDALRISPKKEVVEVKEKGTKRKFGEPLYF